MVKPGIIYHEDTRGNKGLYTIEEMVKNNITISPYAHVIHYANSVFEGIRAVWDKNKEKLYLITLDQHITRLLNSSRSKFHTKFNIEDIYNPKKNFLSELIDDLDFGIIKPNHNKYKFLDLTHSGIKEAIIKTIQENIKKGFIDPKQGCYIRPIVYRDQVWNDKNELDPSLGVFSLNHEAIFEIEAFSWGAYLSGNPKVIIYPYGLDTPLRNIKSGGNYAFGGIVKDYAMARGFSEGIITDSSSDRNVLEGGGENLFVYLRNQILTPDTSQSILPGTKRNLIIQISKNFDYEVVETKIPLKLFMHARSAAFSGTAVGYVGIDRVKDSKTGVKKIFDTGHKPLVKTVNEYSNIISGEDVHKKNLELMEQIRTEVPL